MSENMLLKPLVFLCLVLSCESKPGTTKCDYTGRIYGLSHSLKSFCVECSCVRGEDLRCYHIACPRDRAHHCDICGKPFSPTDYLTTS
ncbi:Hypothetical predicted protein [Octopus vulgaris]|uniref:VWFC domain-containing protein n=1 Tax=Octopus vulgaris TaxID=6645 RepID=A0AA36BXZ4_OCTVU|nr:Hypothetical predicted protein [Octopus vulgaris]